MIWYYFNHFTFEWFFVKQLQFFFKPKNWYWKKWEKFNHFISFLNVSDNSKIEFNFHGIFQVINGGFSYFMVLRQVSLWDSRFTNLSMIYIVFVQIKKHKRLSIEVQIYQYIFIFILYKKSRVCIKTDEWCFYFRIIWSKVLWGHKSKYPKTEYEFRLYLDLRG